MYNLDRIDFEILKRLQVDGRVSNKDLAAEVGLAPSSCLERVRRMRTSGVIRGFTADVDPLAMSIRVQALVAIRLEKHEQAAPDALKSDLLQIAEVQSVYVLAGVDDFLVHVVAGSVEHLRQIVNTAFVGRPNVAHIQTSLIFDYTRSAGLPNLTQS